MTGICRKRKGVIALSFKKCWRVSHTAKCVLDNRSRPLDLVYFAVNSAFGKSTDLQNVVGKRFTEGVLERWWGFRR
jgi:hypothetical protein